MRILVLDEMKALKEALPYWVYACMHTHTHTHTWISLPVHSQRTACQMKFFPSSPHVCVQPALLQSCPTLCDSGDCSLSGCSVHGILQARILEWVAMPSSSESFWSRNGTYISYISSFGRRVLYHLPHLGCPNSLHIHTHPSENVSSGQGHLRGNYWHFFLVEKSSLLSTIFLLLNFLQFGCCAAFIDLFCTISVCFETRPEKKIKEKHVSNIGYSENPAFLFWSIQNKGRKPQWCLVNFQLSCSLSTVNLQLSLTILGFPAGSEVKASACNVGDPGLIPGLGRSPGEGNSNPVQYSYLENPMERGAW